MTPMMAIDCEPTLPKRLPKRAVPKKPVIIEPISGANGIAHKSGRVKLVCIKQLTFKPIKIFSINRIELTKEYDQNC